MPLDLVERDPDARTGLAFPAREDGDRPFTFYRDGTADTRLQPGTVTDETLAGVDWVHVGGVTLADDPARTATYALAERARDAGCTVSFDPNARPELWDEFDFADSVDRALALADVVKATPGDLQAAGIEDDDPAGLARTVLERGPNTVLVTLGEDGAVAATTRTALSTDAPETISHDGYDVEAVDPTGAGDAFTAGAITALSEGESLAEALAFAGAVGAAATTARGAMAGLPVRDAVHEVRRRG